MIYLKGDGVEVVAKFFQEGGIWMYVIGGVCVFAIAITCERFFYLYFHCRVNSKVLLAQVTRMVQRGEGEKGRKLCASIKSPLAVIFESALWHFVQNSSAQTIQNAVDEVGLREIPKIQRRTHYLSLVANVSTLLGLLGTIFGLQEAFTALAAADPSQKAAVLARGISIAMNTTALGLLVAIPNMVLFSFFGAKSNAVIEEIDESCVRLLNFIVTIKKER